MEGAGAGKGEGATDGGAGGNKGGQETKFGLKMAANTDEPGAPKAKSSCC
jgi:hypothetical protein